MAGPRRFDKRPQHAGHEGVSPEQQRERRGGASGDRGPVLNLFMNRIVELRVSIVEMRLPPDRVMKARVAAGAEAGD